MLRLHFVFRTNENEETILELKAINKVGQLRPRSVKCNHYFI
jgi:hypothetical protein